ncbi:MAG: FtsX-like permease family protein [Vicinamibacterales bacterium]|nr:FtsX-like permease family protein [Vicinamibacterales bacterium]
MFALMVGVLAMTAILAGAPMYLSTIESLGLRAMLTQLSSSRNMQIVVDGLPLTDRSVSAATERVEVALEELDDLVVNIGQESHTREHYWATDAQSITGGPYADVALLGRFDGVLDEVEITDGQAPLSSLERLDTHVVVEGLVPTERADQLGIGVGDEIWLTTKPGDLPYLMVRVVGLFEPEDIRSDFWLGLAPEVLAPERPGPEARFRLPLFLTREALFGALTGGPAAIGTNRWLVQFDADLLERQSPTFTAEQVDSVGHELRRGLPESRAISALENPLISLGQKISFARIPTLMMGGVLLLAAGYYSIMAAGALMARRRVDTARMWVRGSGKRQVAVLFLIESALLVILPAVVAPFVAYGAIVAIGWLPEYESITFGLGMPVHISWHAFAWSITGAAVVVGYMQWSVLKGDGQAIGAEQLSNRRVEGKPFFQHQYLDLLFFLFGGVILWDLSTETSVASESGDQVITVNPLLVFAPAIFLAVSVMLSLRVLPPLARLISSGLSRRGPAWAHLISMLFARVPLTYAWPAAILGMAAGTAMLSATVAATLQQNSVDQSGYEAGADLRVYPVDLGSGPRTEVLERLRDIDGVKGISAGFRSTGDIRLGGRGAPFEFLAIEPSEYNHIGVFRDDYAASDVAALIAAMEPDSEIEPLLVPELADRVGLRMRSNLIERNIKASIRLLDANGLSHSVGLGPVNSRDWQVRMGFIPGIAIRPVEIVGLTFFETTTDEVGTPISIQVDDLMYELPLFSMDESRPSSAATLVWDLVVLDSFDGGAEGGTGVWKPLASSRGSGTQTLGFEYARSTDGESRLDNGLQIDLGIGTDAGVRGAVRSLDETVPIVFSQLALVSNNAAVGDLSVVHVFGRSIPVRIIGVADYFPTLDPEGGGFAVVGVTQLWRHLALSSANSARFAAEVFIGLEDTEDNAVIDEVSSEIGGLLSLVDRDEIQRTSVVTPLAVAGWRGASIITGGLAVGLAILGLLTFVPMRPAGDKFNLAVLRALGVRKRGLVFISVIEQLVVLGVGVAAGVGVGLVMARIAVDTVSQTDSNVNSLPPIVFSTDWIYIGGLVVAVLAVGLIVSVFDVISVRRISVAAIVRTSGSKR